MHIFIYKDYNEFINVGITLLFGDELVAMFIAANFS